ncbi:capsule biosynthesis protein CapA [Pseudoalteromonas phenolica]|uniref:Capsule biosynthesis protein CapA n=1 Tax=Pseudoalteromonas phenolica TaxID=161398 RepID=A0A4Q7IU56_9GAMM|nr:CapA family protein [Pseudoalteromonas phenolica]RZQ54797.1 capsule biosynthesis protein CapA [Pseudoalteromonas phenolica]
MPNTSVLFKLTNILTVCISVYFLSACSVEDPYETGPSEEQKKEADERESANKQFIPYELEIKNNSGAPLANITVKVADQVYQSDPNGVIALNTFTLGNYPIEIEHPDYYFTSLTLNISSNKSSEVIELTPKLNNEVNVIFAGDTMFGRRFMDPSITTMGNSVPNLPDAMINQTNAATASIEITKAVAPLFIHSDFASVNLESPVLNQPISVHPTKEFSFFSLPETLEGLTSIGVDYVALGNNHVYDYQLTGLTDTIKFVEEAGLLHSGAGLNAASAYTPIYKNVKGTTLGLVSATSIRGGDHEITYIADDTKGGAADLSDSNNLKAAINASVANSDFTVVQLHGGDEYSYAQTDYIDNRFAFISKLDEKPDLMVAHHPHVAQGFAVYNGVPTLLGLGNFVFDQNRLETVLGLAVEVRVDKTQVPKVTSARAYPIYIDEYKPRLISGDLSNHLIKRVAEFSSNVTVIPKQGYAEIIFNEQLEASNKQQHSIELPAGEHIIDLRDLAPSQSFLTEIESNKEVKQVTFGRDILAFGDFEDWDNDITQFELNHWDHSDEDVQPCLTGAYKGNQGLCLSRDQYDNLSLRVPFKQTVRAFPLTPADDVSQVFHEHTLFGYAKGINAGKLELDLSILTSEDSLVFSEQRLSIFEAGDYAWQPFNLNFELPSDDNLLGPEKLPPRGMRFAFIHSPPQSGNAELQLDDIALISWQDQVQLNNRTWQTTQLHGKTFLRVSTDKAVRLNLTFSQF